MRHNTKNNLSHKQSSMLSVQKNVLTLPLKKQTILEHRSEYVRQTSFDLFIVNIALYHRRIQRMERISFPLNVLIMAHS